MRQFGEGGTPLENNALIKRSKMQNSDKQLALFVRDEKTGRLAFTVQALKALGIDPALAQQRGYPLIDLEEAESNFAA